MIHEGRLDPAWPTSLVDSVAGELALQGVLLDLVRASRAGPASVDGAEFGMADAVFLELSMRRAAGRARAGNGGAVPSSRLIGLVSRREAARLRALRRELGGVIASVSAEGRARARKCPARIAVAAAA